MLTHAPAQPGEASDALEAAARRAAAAPRRHAGARRLHGQVDRYLRALAWVARDALPRWKAQVAAIVLCNLLGLVAMAAALWAVMSYARAAESRQPVRLLGRMFEIGDGRSLLLFGAAIAGLGLLSAACTFMVDRLILLLARRYHAMCVERAIAYAGDPMRRGWQVMDDDPPRVILARLAGGGSRIMGLVLRDMLRIILPALTLIATLAFLLYLDSTLTFVLIPAAAAYLLALYLINRRVSLMQRTYRERAPQARAEIGRRLRGLIERGVAQPDAQPVQRIAADGALAALYGRLLADRRVHLLNAAFFIVCLVALLLFFGLRAGGEGRAWSDLIFYLIALRYAMTSLKQATTLAAKFSRFFPEFSFYGAFVANGERDRAERLTAAKRPAPAWPDHLTLRLGRQAQWDSPRVLRLHRTGILVVLTVAEPGYADLEAVALRIEQRLDEHVDLAADGQFIMQADALERAAPTENATFFIAASVAMRPRAQRWIAEPDRRGTTLVIVVGENPKSMLGLPANLLDDASVAVLSGARFIGGGDIAWLRRHVDEISAYLLAQAEQSRARGQGTDIADDVDDEAEE